MTSPSAHGETGRFGSAAAEMCCLLLPPSQLLVAAVGGTYDAHLDLDYLRFYACQLSLNHRDVASSNDSTCGDYDSDVCPRKL